MVQVPFREGGCKCARGVASAPKGNKPSLMENTGSSRKRKREEAEESASGKDSAANEGKDAGSSHGSEEVHFVRGEGQYMFDDKGQKYLDIMNSTSHVGHCHPTVVSMAAKQMAELNTNTRFINDRMITFAEKLTSCLPDSLTKCIFVNSRSEANDLALRIAAVATGHTHCISVSGCYHGHLQSLRALRGDYPSSVCSQVPTPDVYRGKFKDSETAGGQYAREVEKIVEGLVTEGKSPCCFIHETVITNSGMCLLPQGYLAPVYRSVREAGGVCIADEAESGLGRLGSQFWGFQTHGVVPDIVTLGESMGNGHPVGALVTTKEIADKFAQGASYFNTFGGNPVSMVIASSVLEVVQSEGLQENASAVGTFLTERLKQLQERHGIVGSVRGLGLSVGVEIVSDNGDSRRPDPDKARDIVAKLLKKHRILAQVDDVGGNVIRVKPPMCFSMENAKELVSALDAILIGSRMTTTNYC